MHCKNHAPFHAGISKEACASVSGYWNRSPCKQLQACLQDYPKEGEPGYSEAFAEFAKFQIEDASNQHQCGKAREQLGFVRDEVDDTQVCESFKELPCHQAFTDLKNLTSASPSGGVRIFNLS